MTPQFHPFGRFQARFDLRNMEYFVMMLNREIELFAAGRTNCHVLDIDRVAASIGRRYMQDDTITASNHNALLENDWVLHGRIEKLGPLSDYFEVRRLSDLPNAVLAELDAMYRTVRQADSVKLVVVDLDDTLWQGVSGEQADVGPEMVEGWPIGVVEALLALRARGILLGIASKNDEARIGKIFPIIFGDRLRLEDFAAVQISWQPKMVSMAAILKETNLLPHNVLFIDDNPAERKAMLAAFPSIRVTGQNPYLLRRILLLAPETQTVTITAESARRTDMVQSQIAREAARTTLTPEAFARQQDVRVRLGYANDAADPRFARALELINKTNQFNTTGQRWTEAECRRFFAAGGRFALYHVEDRYTPYGLVGVVILDGHTIAQWVMSCRVIGLGVESAVLHTLVARLRASGATEIKAMLGRTEHNQPCQNFYAAAGFVLTGNVWSLPAGAEPPPPRWVAIAVL